jgi:hypothetical protein
MYVCACGRCLHCLFLSLSRQDGVLIEAKTLTPATNNGANNSSNSNNANININITSNGGSGNSVGSLVGKEGGSGGQIHFDAVAKAK